MYSPSPILWAAGTRVLKAQPARGQYQTPAKAMSDHGGQGACSSGAGNCTGPILALSLLRWCTVSELELAKCSAMSKAFSRAGLLPPLACVNGGSTSNCTWMINTSRADVATVDGGTIYQAGKEYSLKPVVGEAYGQDAGTSYYAVAVVRAASNLTINTLRGSKTCHTGINRTVGWTVPIGFLIDSGRMPVMGCDVAGAVGDYFKASCVPGASGQHYPTSLCELCKGDEAGQGKCEPSSQEAYYDYSGAFRCLVEGAGDVAFVKHSTVAETIEGQAFLPWAQQLQLKDFQLLCRDGSKAAVTEWRRCHLARVPAHAVIARADMDGSLVFQLLNQGQQMFNNGGSGFQMFDSAAYRGQNLLFKDSTTELVPILEQTYQAWLGDEYLHAMLGLDCDPQRLPTVLRWCVLSAEEIHKCSAMARAFRSKNLKPDIQCVSAQSREQCMDRIQRRDIDAVVLAGEDIYTAGETYGLVPAAGEHYAGGDTTSTYYAVAVVRRATSSAFTIQELSGKKSCHSGYGRMAGWKIPVGLLLRKGLIQSQDCSSLPEAVSAFFSASCVPAAAATRREDYPASLCELCIGDREGSHKCNASTEERYYGCTGAFRCLAEDRGDVAFVKHSSVFENTDGNNSNSWASQLRSEDFQLLCPNGARAEVSQFAECHWGQLPARAIMVHPDTNALAVYGLLDKAQDFFGDDNNTNGFKMFNSVEFHGQDLIFKDSTIEIVPTEGRTTATSWLGQQFLDSLEGLQSVQCSGAAAEADLPSPTPTSGQSFSEAQLIVLGNAEPSPMWAQIMRGSVSLRCRDSRLVLLSGDESLSGWILLFMSNRLKDKASARTKADLLPARLSTQPADLQETAGAGGGAESGCGGSLPGLEEAARRPESIKPFQHRLGCPPGASRLSKKRLPARCLREGWGAGRERHPGRAGAAPGSEGLRAGRAPGGRGLGGAGGSPSRAAAPGPPGGGAGRSSGPREVPPRRKAAAPDPGRKAGLPEPPGAPAPQRHGRGRGETRLRAAQPASPRGAGDARSLPRPGPQFPPGKGLWASRAHAGRRDRLHGARPLAPRPEPCGGRTGRRCSSGAPEEPRGGRLPALTDRRGPAPGSRPRQRLRLLESRASPLRARRRVERREEAALGGCGSFLRTGTGPAGGSLGPSSAFQKGSSVSGSRRATFDGGSPPPQRLGGSPSDQLAGLPFQGPPLKHHSQQSMDMPSPAIGRSAKAGPPSCSAPVLLSSKESGETGRGTAVPG
ncbi:melanotransferrin-like [Tiliqua scincoides]|uniref:melanotransferrin-like n=1 Tax=Tiliqua scincoides TaxID=71010 RepID=UPI0034628C8C